MKPFWRRVLHFKLIQALLLVCLVSSQTGCINTAKQLRLERIESNTYSGLVTADLQFMVISNEEVFRELYAKIHSLKLPRPSPPDIDFERYHVLLAFLGQQSTAGHSIDFYDVVLQGNSEIKVTMRLNSPQPGNDLAQVITTPYAIAKVAKGNYTTAQFVDELNNVLDAVNVN